MDAVMASFSSTEAAFEGFRLTREHPRAVLAWAAANFVFALIIAVITVAWIGPQFASWRALALSANPDVTQMAAAMRKLAPYCLVVVPLEAVFSATMICAIYRAVLRPNERGVAYFRLGEDELRMVALLIILTVLSLAAMFVFLLVEGVVAGTLGAFGSPAGAFLGSLIGSAAVCVAIWLGVRLSLAAPMTFDQRRLVVFGSWGFTRGSFLPLLGAYVLAFLLGVVISLLMAVISGAVISVAILASGGALTASYNFQADLSSLATFLTLPTVLSQALGAILSTVISVIVLSPSAIAYQGMAGRAASADVFG
jgi:hypothetical protein